MKPKRKVSKNLGRTQHRRADKLYYIFRQKYGQFRSCPFYGGNKYDEFDTNSHNRLNPKYQNPNVPIEQFDFMKAGDGTWKLQAYCKICYKAYRDARIKIARSRWINSDDSSMADDQIRKWYRENVGSTMQCSVCKKNLDPKDFPISRSMEKGLHNECFNCQIARATSVREQEWLSDGNWASWKKAVEKLRSAKKVKCAGWSRSVETGACLDLDTGKRMHADHIVPLRAGGIHDAKNFQPLCSICNSKKSDQIDPDISVKQVKKLVGRYYKNIIKNNDSVNTIERKLKSAVANKIFDLVSQGKYLKAIKTKKKQVNGQWDVARAYRKGLEWISKIKAGAED